MPILNWLSRDEDVRTVRKVPYRLLESVPDLSVGEADSPNMLIQGDNLEALKALLPFYAGRVKCIYIDPPYNTRSAFKHYDDNLEHAKWLGMIWPRLEILRDLLAEDGSIWVSIDDNECHYLKIVLDEIFGRKNFISNVIWQKRVSPANDAKYLSSDHDHILLYAKNRESWRPNRLHRTETQNSYYKNPDNDLRGDWNSVTYTGNKTKEERPNLYYGINNPNTGEVVFPPDTLTWRYGPETHRKNEEANLLYWGKNGTAKVPRFKMFLTDAEPTVPRSVWSANECGSTQVSMTEQKALFEIPFGTPKPERLIHRILHISTKPNDIVVDSFLGSGTTAAVAHKMGRRYIGIEMGDHAVTHCCPRLMKVIEGEQGGISEDVAWKGGGGFRFYRLGPPVFDEGGHIQADIRFPVLAAHVWFSETGIPWRGKGKSPILGIYDGRAYVLLYNGILGDKRPDAGNVLTRATLALIQEAIAKKESEFRGPLTVYGELSRIMPATLDRMGIVFKQTPYDIKARA